MTSAKYPAHSSCVVTAVDKQLLNPAIAPQRNVANVRASLTSFLSAGHSQQSNWLLKDLLASLHNLSSCCPSQQEYAWRGHRWTSCLPGCGWLRCNFKLLNWSEQRTQIMRSRHYVSPVAILTTWCREHIGYAMAFTGMGSVLVCGGSNLGMTF